MAKPHVLIVEDEADIAGLIPPRCLFVESGTKDDIFPIAATRGAVADAKQIFTRFGTPERLAFEEFEGDHHFWGKGAFSFLGHWL